MNDRAEIKFRLSEHQADLLKKEIEPYLERDVYAEENSGYQVTSHYFDSSDLKAFRDKMEGESIRLKYRLRTYDRQSKNWKLEFKHKKYGRVFKQVEAITEDDVSGLLSGRLQAARGPLMEEFLRRVQLFGLQPIVCIEYWRDAFVSKADNRLRLTFDSQLNYYQSGNNFYAHESSSDRMIIFESKFKDEPPKWLAQVMRRLHLKVEPYSKYVEAVKAIRI